ncbi:MAG: biotin transporter BioY [Acidaminococcaceae bacterium]|nr:biotin transporter BioY [Acidaminococcaceae bacterium]MDD4722444.1 biotin transporter BioY [Acidaminococcaceae bacterium]
MQQWKAKEIILCALFTALTAIGAFIKIPVGTDVFTLQFLFTLLAGLLLGGKMGAASVGIYVLLGLIGVPVLANGGGPGYILQPTFGYLIGFVLQAWFNGTMSRRAINITVKNLLGVNLGGMLIVYIFGLAYFYIISNYVIATPIAWWTLILYGGILQMPGDFLLCYLAAILGVRLYKAGIWVNLKA